jgi:hypothetical protein
MHALLTEIEAVPALRRFSRVARIEGLLVEVTGAAGAISLGGQVRLTASNSKQISCEVVGFRDDRGLPIDTFARPTDRERAWPRGMSHPPLRAQPAPAYARSRRGGKLDLGLARRVAVKATSEESALLCRQAARVLPGSAEQLQDQSLHVLLLMDNVTRFTMAQRGLSAGAPARLLSGRHDRGCRCRQIHPQLEAFSSRKKVERSTFGRRVCRAEPRRRRGHGER